MTSSLFRRLQTVLPLFQHTHILSHQIVNRFQLSFHSLDVFERTGIFKLFLLCLDDPVKPDKIVVTIDSLEPGLIIGSSQRALDFIKERRYNGVDEAVGQFDGICLLDNDGKHHMTVDFIVDAIGGIIYLFERCVFSFGI